MCPPHSLRCSLYPCRWLFEGNPPLDLAERRQILPPVIQLRGARIGMVRHILCGFERSAILQEYRDARAPEGVIAKRLRQARVPAPLLYNAQHIAPGKGCAVHPVRFVHRRKQRRVRSPDCSYHQVRIEKFLRLVMQPDELFLVPFSSRRRRTRLPSSRY